VVVAEISLNFIFLQYYLYLLLNFNNKFLYDDRKLLISRSKDAVRYGFIKYVIAKNIVFTSIFKMELNKDEN